MNTVKSIIKSDLPHESKNRLKPGIKMSDDDFDCMISEFKSIVKICESLITDSINSTDPKNNYVSLTNIFNKINIAISFNTFINKIFSYTACDKKLQDNNEVKFENNYYLALNYVDDKHPFLVKDGIIIGIKINNIYNHLNTFIKLCYNYSNKYDHVDESVPKKLYKLPLQELNNYISKTNTLLKVEIPYLLKNTKTSKKKVAEDNRPKKIDIKHNVRKSDIEVITHSQINDPTNKKNAKTKIIKQKQVYDTDNESNNSDNRYTNDIESKGARNKNTKNISTSNKIGKCTNMNSTDNSDTDNAADNINSSDDTNNDSE